MLERLRPIKHQGNVLYRLSSVSGHVEMKGYKIQVSILRKSQTKYEKSRVFFHMRVSLRGQRINSIIEFSHRDVYIVVYRDTCDKVYITIINL